MDGYMIVIKPINKSINNDFIIIKNYQMNLQSYINVARKQFYGLDTSASKRVLEKYGWEELELTSDKLSAFVKKATSQQLDKTVSNGVNRFFAWYYLNYADADNWEVKIYYPALKDVHNICSHPVNKYEDNGDICFKKCNRDTADLWSVYIQTSEGEYCVADCKSELIATRLEELLIKIIKNCKVKLLLDIEELTVKNLLSSHTIDVLFIDRSIDEHVGKAGKVFTIRRNSDINEFYKRMPVASEQDLRIRNLVKSTSF
jgi:hypothetical protein